MSVKDGDFIVLKGSMCAPYTYSCPMPEVRKQAVVKDNILQSNVVLKSPSMAALVVLGSASNGWTIWKTENGDFIDTFRKRK